MEERWEEGESIRRFWRETHRKSMGEIERVAERKCMEDRESGRSAGYCAEVAVLPRSSSPGGSSHLLVSIQQQAMAPLISCNKCCGNVCVLCCVGFVAIQAIKFETMI